MPAIAETRRKEEWPVRAVWYDRQGPAAQVLQTGELPAPEPGPGEMAVNITGTGPPLVVSPGCAGRGGGLAIRAPARRR